MKTKFFKNIKEDFPYLDYDVLETIDIEKNDILINKVVYQVIDLMSLCNSCGYQGGGSGTWCTCLVQVMLNIGFDKKKLDHFPAIYLADREKEYCRFYKKQKTKFHSMID